MWNADVSRGHIVGECEPYKEKRVVLEVEMRTIDGFDMETCGTLAISELTIAVLGDRW